MVKIYKCDICNYSSNILFNYYTHLKSKKHKANTLEQTNNTDKQPTLQQTQRELIKKQSVLINELQCMYQEQIKRTAELQHINKELFKNYQEIAEKYIELAETKSTRPINVYHVVNDFTN